VRVRGEISRLQVRQQMLTLERQNFENFKASIERQHEQLARIADDIALRTPTGLQADAEQAAREAAFLGRDRSGFTSPPTTVGPATTAAAAPALGSFGLSNASTA